MEESVGVRENILVDIEVLFPGFGFGFKSGFFSWFCLRGVRRGGVIDAEGEAFGRNIDGRLVVAIWEVCD